MKSKMKRPARPMKKLKADCGLCDGTGVFFWQKNSAHICSTCYGKGYVMIEYYPFKKKRMIEGAITYLNFDGGQIHYKDFLKNKKFR